MPGPFTLGKNERLKRRRIIDQLFSEGKYLSVFPLRVGYVFTEKLEHPLQAGFGVSSRQFKRSVQRNRIKRLMREGYRLQKNELQEVVQNKNLQLALFIIYVGRELPDYATVSEKMQVALNRLLRIVHETGAQDI